MLPEGMAMLYAKRKRLIEWQRPIELLHISVNPETGSKYIYLYSGSTYPDKLEMYFRSDRDLSICLSEKREKRRRKEHKS
jgi:hypothetical protein